MSRRAKLGIAAALAATFVLAGPVTREAEAIKPFQEAFYAKYLKRDSADAKDKAFVSTVESAKCFLCHQGKSKKTRNPYGAQLAELLDKNTDKDNAEKIAQALDKVAGLKSDPKDEKSPTFGALIAAGQLPGGEPQTN